MVVEQEDRIQAESLLGAADAPKQKLSAWQRARLLGVGLMRALMPSLPIPGYCPGCWARMELAREARLEPKDWEDGYDFGGPTLVRGVRFWICSQCGRTDCQRYGYLRDVYPYREH